MSKAQAQLLQSNSLTYRVKSTVTNIRSSQILPFQLAWFGVSKDGARLACPAGVLSTSCRHLFRVLIALRFETWQRSARRRFGKPPRRQVWCERACDSLGNRCDFTRVASRRCVDNGNVSCTSATSCQRIVVDCRHVGNPTPIELANFDDNQGHVVGEGTVPPGSYAVED